MSSPEIFAPHPLCTTPQAAAGVPIYAYVTGKEIDWSAPARTHDFAGIDVDAWAREIFAAIDRMLTPALAIPAAVLGAKDDEQYLAQIVNAKRTLVASLRTLAIPLFAAEAAEGAEAVSGGGESEEATTRAAGQAARMKEAREAIAQAAREAFEQSLVAQLSSAFAPLGPPWLRAIPEAPTMVVQHATRSAAVAGAPATAAGRTTTASGSAFARWDFAFTYSRPQHAPQDLIQGKVRFNRCETRRAAKAQQGKDKKRDAGAGEAGSGAAPARAGDRGAGTAGPLRGATGGSSSGTGSGAGGGASAEGAANELLQAMAQAMALLPDVSRDLTHWVPRLDAATPDETALVNARAALRAFTALVGRVADSWTTFPAPPADAGAMRGGGPDTYGFTIREREVAVGGKPALLVSIYGGTPPGTGEPRIEIDGYAATPYPVAGGAGYVYVRAADEACLDPDTARGILQRTLILPGLDVLARQDGCASLQVVRNAALLEDRTVRTAEPFVYRTEWVRFENAIQPTIDVDDPIDIATLASAASAASATSAGSRTDTANAPPAAPPPSLSASLPAVLSTPLSAPVSTPLPAPLSASLPAPVTRPLVQHVSALFAAIFGTDPLPVQLVQLDVTYAHAIAEGLPPVEIPVLRQPPPPTTLRLPFDYQVPTAGCPPALDGDSGRPHACQIGDALRSWYESARPTGTGGAFRFDLTVFTTLDDTPTPLLRVRRASLDLRHVDPPLPAA